MAQLSAGVCLLLRNIATPDHPFLASRGHRVQILSIRQLVPADRYRIVLSDGLHYMQALLHTRLNGLVANQQLRKYAIVMLEAQQLATATIEGRTKRYFLFLLPTSRN